MTATENGFDRRGNLKDDKNLRENVKVKVRVVAAVPCLVPFSAPIQSLHASSNCAQGINAYIYP
jgi:hypothetical protein